MTAMLDHTLETVYCSSYEPGHRLHWSVWSMTQLAPAITAGHIEVSGTHVLIELDGQRAFDWRHHDPIQLSCALERAFGPVRIYPSRHILNVDGWWFSCAPTDTAFSSCV